MNGWRRCAGIGHEQEGADRRCTHVAVDRAGLIGRDYVVVVHYDPGDASLDSELVAGNARIYRAGLSLA